jgi:hypothetical protein
MLTTEYHKIETLYDRDDKTHRLKEPLRLKNRAYGIVNPWVFTEKIDGTNIRCEWKKGAVTFGGRTANAQIHADLVKWLYANVTPEKFAAAFSTAEYGVTLYGEGYGAGIQKGGGDYSPEKKLILFDVAVYGVSGRTWWLSDEGLRDVGRKMQLDVVPVYGDMSLADATELVRTGFPSRVGNGRRAEGLVGRPVEPLFDKRGNRLIVKLKTGDFNEKLCIQGTPNTGVRSLSATPVSGAGCVGIS